MEIDASTPSGATAPVRMQCMEVWGGTEFAERQVELTGLDACVYSRPHGDARGGGDVYYLSSCASGRISRVLIADVAGHGEGAWQLGRSLRDLMRKNINYISQARLVRSINEQYNRLSKGSRFATALVGTYFAPRQSFVLSTAGHPLPLVYRAANRDWSELPLLAARDRAPAGLSDAPLGIFDQTNYGQFKLKLAPGDLVLCFSDGLAELPASAGGIVGTQGLLQTLRELDVSRPEGLIRNLLERVAGAVAAAHLRDDITIVLLRPNGKGVPLLNTLRAPFRIIRGLLSAQS